MWTTLQAWEIIMMGGSVWLGELPGRSLTTMSNGVYHNTALFYSKRTLGEEMNVRRCEAS